MEYKLHSLLLSYTFRIIRTGHSGGKEGRIGKKHFPSTRSAHTASEEVDTVWINALGTDNEVNHLLYVASQTSPSQIPLGALGYEHYGGYSPRLEIGSDGFNSRFIHLCHIVGATTGATMEIYHQSFHFPINRSNLRFSITLRNHARKLQNPMQGRFVRQQKRNRIGTGRKAGASFLIWDSSADMCWYVGRTTRTGIGYLLPCWRGP